MNDEVTHQSVNLAIRMSKATVQALVDGLKKAKNKLEEEIKQAANKPEKEKSGQMSVKDLVKQGQGVTSISIEDDDGLRDFRKMGKKYGVDFAIVKDSNTNPPTYTAFFKAKDLDAINHIVEEHAAKKAKEQTKESVKDQIKRHKEKAKSEPKREKNKTRERTR